MFGVVDNFCIFTQRLKDITGLKNFQTYNITAKLILELKITAWIVTTIFILNH